MAEGEPTPDEAVRDVHNHVLFEISTEVAHRGMQPLARRAFCDYAGFALTLLAVGGIYSVLKSKAQVTTAEYGATYTMLGPLNRSSVRVTVLITFLQPR